MNKLIKYFSILLNVIVVFSCSTIEDADLVITGGKVATIDKDFSFAEAVAVKDGKIIFVGSDEDVKWYIDKGTDHIELNGGLVLPGLIDAHGHLTGYGESLEYIDLVGTNSYDEILDLVKEKLNSVNPGDWIRGRGWDQNDWEKLVFPQHNRLSEISPNNPVVLTRIDGHALLANAKAMKMAGINKSTKDPSGGKILRDKHGNPTGVFIDNAEQLITDHIPAFSKDEIRRIIKNGAHHLTQYGITGIHDAGISISRISDYKFLIDNGYMPIRINAMLSDTSAVLDDNFLNEHKINSYGDDFLRVKSIKLYADGALGSRGAALAEPYSDDPNNKGLILTDSLYMLQITKVALENDFQVCTHAIGDGGIRTVLNIYETALSTNPKQDHRFRIEHSQIVNLDDVERYAELGVIPAMQPQHAISDMPWVEDRIGIDRMNGAYAWRSFIDAGLIIPCGSDVPVEVPDPLIGIYNAITRQDENRFPQGGWISEQKMTIEEAVKGYTIWPAQSAFQEGVLGSIELSKCADFTILNTNIFEIEPIQILDTEILYTIVAGDIQYKSPNIRTTF